uniref:Uncharacterized protein n=1 Tax=Fundulus heteroclitus TaxID=8078 RepID=A0A3Q2Q106_FUNHE
MSFSRSKLTFLLYGIFLCSLNVTLTLSKTKHSIHNARSLVHSSSYTLHKREDAERDGQYLLGIKRIRRLYCNVGIGFHIQVLPNGKITGVHNENKYSKYTIHFVIKVKLSMGSTKYVHSFFFCSKSFSDNEISPPQFHPFLVHLKCLFFLFYRIKKSQPLVSNHYRTTHKNKRTNKTNNLLKVQ